MQIAASGTDRVRSFLVLAATIGTIAFNWLTAVGRLGGITPADISEKYPTAITPAGYAFSIWSLIYLGLIAFSIYQILPANLARFRAMRSVYIFSCALNCAWLYFWIGDRPDICFAILFALSITLLFINLYVRRNESLADFWMVKAPFGLYFGWVTEATFVNFAVLLAYLDVRFSESAATALGVGLILLAAALGVFARIRITNYMFPLAVAWALTAIGVEQSGHTLIVVAAAVGVVACLIAASSFIINLPTRSPGSSGPPSKG